MLRRDRDGCARRARVSARPPGAAPARLVQLNEDVPSTGRTSARHASSTISIRVPSATKTASLIHAVGSLLSGLPLGFRAWRFCPRQADSDRNLKSNPPGRHENAAPAGVGAAERSSTVVDASAMTRRADDSTSSGRHQGREASTTGDPPASSREAVKPSTASTRRPPPPSAWCLVR